MKAKVLLYGVNAEKHLPLREAFHAFGIELIQVTKEDLGKTVGYLAGLEDCPERPPKEAVFPQQTEGEFMVMCGFSKLQFDLIMNLFRKKKVPPIGIKAMLTQQNQNWSLGQLLEELSQEHAMMTEKKNDPKKE